MDKLYFFLYYPTEQKDNPSDFQFTEPDNESEKPECIYYKKEHKNKKYYYLKIFMAKSSSKEKYEFAFVIGDYKYEISFDNTKATFIYEVNLEYGLSIIPIRRKIYQNKIEYKNKLDFFIKAIEEKNEKEKTNETLENEKEQKKELYELYKDTITLYSKKKGFNFFIPLFTKIYKEQKLCEELMKNFRDTDEKLKVNNMDRKANLKDYTSVFYNILENAKINEDFTEINNVQYNTVDFYGTILCYLNYYDKEKFSEVIDELSRKNLENLYDIMLIYRYHFKNPIKKDLAFFNKFISHSIDKKDFSIFKIGLTYIKDFETFIYIIDKNKDSIYINFEKIFNDNYIIKIDKNIKLKCTEKKDEHKNENEGETISESNNISNESKEITSSILNEKQRANYIKNIDSILNFSLNKEKVFINFTNDFWKYIINCYKTN